LGWGLGEFGIGPGPNSQIPGKGKINPGWVNLRGTGLGDNGPEARGPWGKLGGENKQPGYLSFGGNGVQNPLWGV